MVNEPDGDVWMSKVALIICLIGVIGLLIANFIALRVINDNIFVILTKLRQMDFIERLKKNDEM
jgi:hypothetical protein